MGDDTFVFLSAVLHTGKGAVALLIQQAVGVICTAAGALPG